MKKITNKEKRIITRMVKSWNNKDTSDLQKETIETEITTLRKGKIKYAKNYVNTNSNSPYAPFVLNLYIRNYLSIDQLDSMYQTFTKDVKRSNYGSQLGKTINGIRMTEVGKPFLDFTMPDIDGKPLNLSYIVKNNKLVFIDFWASWCGPCRAALPEIKEIYNEFHPLGLEILGVSYDNDDVKWKKAIKEEDINWPNCSNLKGWNCPTVGQYAINGIPANILISTDGVIVANNLHGKKLITKIKELLKS